MVYNEFFLLTLTSAGIAFLHTLSGPDHYLPFIALSRSRGWGLMTTMGWTMLCGIAHIAGSLLVGCAGLGLGWGVQRFRMLDNLRGGLSGWMLLLFGLCYLIWGLLRSGNNPAHRHFEQHEDGELYVFEHRHQTASDQRERHRVTPWVMLLIFLLGPAEPLIPLFFAPAVKGAYGELMVTLVSYTFATLATMLLMVLAGWFGLFRLDIIPEKYVPALSGFLLFISGAGMVFFNW